MQVENPASLFLSAGFIGKKYIPYNLEADKNRHLELLKKCVDELQFWIKTQIPIATQNICAPENQSNQTMHTK